MKLIMVFALSLALFFVTSPAVAASLPDIDLSAMSFDDLFALRARIDAALWASDEWQEVTVPAGVYEIGVDIPAGYWTITALGTSVDLTWTDKLNATKTGYAFGYSFMASETLWAKGTIFNEDGNKNACFVNWDLKENAFLIIEDGSVVFTPFTGAPLGFK